MQSGAQGSLAPKKMLWTGRIVSVLIALFMLFDGTIKVMKLAPAMQGTVQLGFPASLVQAIGIVALICAVLYAIPSTAVLGAILLTGYLGGAVAIQLRVGTPLLSETLFPVYVGALVWGGLYLRDARLRALVPLRGRARPHDSENCRSAINSNHQVAL